LQINSTTAASLNGIHFIKVSNQLIYSEWCQKSFAQ